MDFSTAELLPVPRIFLATLLHFVWQATVVVALVAIARGLVQPRYCQMRYAISVVGLVVVLALPLMTLGYYSANPESLALASPLVLEDSMVQSGMAAVAMSEPGGLFAVCESQFQTVFTWFDSHRSFWLGGWLLGFAVLVLRLSLSLGHCFRLRRDQTPLPAPLQRIADDLKLKLNLTQGIIVGVSTHITQAVATGVIKPIVLIPAAWVTQLPLTAIEAVLAHELAHVKRWDLWVNLIQRFTETVFFFHPLVWWLSQKISHEREICCDQLAVRVTGQPIHYVETLAHVAGNPCEGFEFQFGTAFTGGKNMNLLRRAKLILEPTSVNAQTPFRTLVLLACAGLLTTYGSYAYAATAAAAIQQDRDDHEDEHEHEHDDEHEHEHQDDDRRQGRKFMEYENFQREHKARHFELRRLEGSEVRDDEQMRDLHLQWTDILRQNKSGDVSKRELAQQLREIADRLETQEGSVVVDLTRTRLGPQLLQQQKLLVREGNLRRYLEFPEIVVDLNDARERRMRPDDPRWRVEVQPEREDRPEARGYREGSRFSRDDNEYFDVEVHDELSEMEIEEEHGDEHEHRNRFMRRSDNEKLVELEFMEREEQDDIHEEHGHERRSVEEDLGQVVRELMGEVRELRREVERLQSDRRPTEVRERIEMDRNVEMDRRMHAERQMEQDRKNLREHQIQLERELRPDRIRESRRDKASTEGFPGYRVRRAGDRDELKVDEDEFGRFTIDQLRFNIERSGNQAAEEEGFDSRHEDHEHGDHEHEDEGRDGDQEVIEIEISEPVLNVIEVKNNKKK